LSQELGGAVTFNAPQGGMFFWSRLTAPNADAAEFAKRAIEKMVAFVPGAPFFATDVDKATFRLSFATADVSKIIEGVQRLGKAL
jgi:DNA-binding transcriptional MocR family regulator